MPTGLQIRDFSKQTREVQYTDQGSIRLSEIEHNAYLNRLTVEITHYDANRSINFKSLPESTHWGYITSFKGSSVIDKVAVKFVKQRVFEHINSGIWQYHQASETVNLGAAKTESAVNAIIRNSVFGDAAAALVRVFIKAKDSLTDALSNNAAWLVGYRSFDEGESTEPAYPYTAFPIASPFPDVFKFKSDIPLSFKFRLESWYLVNPAVYVVSNPTDTSDETEDEDEYPTPEPGDNDGQGEEFPPSSAPPSGSDPRDFEEGLEDGTGTWTFTISYGNGGGNPFCLQVPATTIALRGFPDEPPKKRFTGPQKLPEGGTPGEYYTSVDTAVFGGDCTVSDVVNPVFIADGPSS